MKFLADENFNNDILRGLVIDALELIILASDESDWIGKVTYIPFD